MFQIVTLSQFKTFNIKTVFACLSNSNILLEMFVFKLGLSMITMTFLLTEVIQPFSFYFILYGET